MGSKSLSGERQENAADEERDCVPTPYDVGAALLPTFELRSLSKEWEGNRAGVSTNFSAGSSTMAPVTSLASPLVMYAFLYRLFHSKNTVKLSTVQNRSLQTMMMQEHSLQTSQTESILSSTKVRTSMLHPVCYWKTLCILAISSTDKRHFLNASPQQRTSPHR